MPDPAVVDASPPILLAKAGGLELLRAFGRDLLVPDVVAEELRAKGSDDPVVQSVENATWLRVVPVPPTQPSVVAGVLGLASPRCSRVPCSTLIRWLCSTTGRDADVLPRTGLR